MKTLVVEDDFLARALLSKMLSEFGVCHVAINGVEAVKSVDGALTEGMPYDLICMDIMMPVMNGHEALLKIRNLEKERGVFGTDTVRVIMVTAIDDSVNITQAFRSGHCEVYHPKPIDRGKLLMQIRDMGLLE